MLLARLTLVSLPSMLSGVIAAPRVEQTRWRQECRAPTVAAAFRLPNAGLDLQTIVWNSKVSIGRARLVVVGNPPSATTATDSSPQSQFRGLTVEAHTGELRRIPSPEFGHDWLRPVAAIDSLGVIHVAWAESGELQSDSKSYASPADARIVFYAQYGRSGWSAPERVYSGGALVWTDVTRLTLARGEVVLVFPAASGSGIPTITVARRARAGHWSVAEAPREYATVYTDIVALPNGNFVIGHTGPNQTLDGDGQAVFATVRTERSSPWQPRQLVHGDGRPAVRVRIVRDARTIHLLWAQSKSKALHPELVDHAESVDGGATWRLQPAIPQQGMYVNDFYPVIDACGRLYSIANVSDQGGLIRYAFAATWDGKAWSSPDTLAGGVGNGLAHSVHAASGPFAGGVVVVTTQSAIAAQSRTVLYAVR